MVDSNETPSEASGGESTDRFEVIAAILLGVAALFAAWAGHQAGLWGGNCLTAYSEAGSMATKGANLYQEAGAEVIRDSSLDITAKQRIMEALDEDPGDDREAKMKIARYLLTQQLSEAAYKELKLPAEFYNKDGWEKLSADVLEASLDEDISDEYWDRQLEPAEEVFEQADAKFKEGREANTKGDKFNFAGVLFTVAMFFLGISPLQGPLGPSGDGGSRAGGHDRVHVDHPQRRRGGLTPVGRRPQRAYAS